MTGPTHASASSRRSFLSTLGRALAVVSMAPRIFAHAVDQFSPEIADLYRKSVVIDTLCGPFTSDDGLPDKAAIDAVRQSGITAINFTISAPTFEGTIDAWRISMRWWSSHLTFSRSFGSILTSLAPSARAKSASCRVFSTLSSSRAIRRVSRRFGGWAYASCSSLTTTAASSAMDAWSRAMPD